MLESYEDLENNIKDGYIRFRLETDDKDAFYENVVHKAGNPVKSCEFLYKNILMMK